MLSGVQPAVRTILQKVGAFQMMRKDHEFSARLPALKNAAILLDLAESEIETRGGLS